MADELSTTVSTRYAKSGQELPNLSVTKAITVSGTPAKDVIISIGTSEVQIDTTGFTLTGFLQIIHRGTANFVEYGGATGAYSGKLMPGEPNLVRMNAWTGLFLKADTAAVIVQIRIFSN